MPSRYSGSHYYDESEPTRKKDRKRAEQDLKINLKAELEIKIINRKVDAILNFQQSSWRTIQQINFDVLEDLMAEVKSRNKGD